MEQQPYQPLDHAQPIDLTAESSRLFMARVFTWMTVGLVLTGITAVLFGTTELVNYMVEHRVDGSIGMKPLAWIVMLAPFGFILAMNFGFNKFSARGLIGLFIAFSAVMGMSLYYIFLLYTDTSIIQVFFITAGTFATMAFLGYTTKTDLTKLGSMLYMALIGLVIAIVVNMFMGSDSLSYIISCVGVLIFTGLTAYDTQKLKRIGAGVEFGSATASKLAILGATSLYLDFINLFLFLLRMLGSRD